MAVLLLRPEELQGLVTMKEAIDIVEQAYRETYEYPAIGAPRRRVHSPANVRVSNFPGGVHALGVIGTGTRPDKINPGGDTRPRLSAATRSTWCTIPTAGICCPS